MNLDKIDNCEKNIINTLDNKFSKIKNNYKHYELKALTPEMLELTNEELNQVLEKIINKKLLEIRNSNLSFKTVYDRRREIETFEESFYLTFNDSNEEGETIAWDLVAKVLKRNNREIELPIDINKLIQYSIHSSIDNSNVKDTLLWLALEVFAINYLVVKICSNK